MALTINHNLNSISSSGNSLSLTMNGSLLVPKGTTAQRPGAPVEGMIRYNTDLGILEIFDNSSTWQPVGTGSSSSGGGDGLVYSLILG